MGVWEAAVGVRTLKDEIPAFRELTKSRNNPSTTRQYTRVMASTSNVRTTATRYRMGSSKISSVWEDDAGATGVRKGWI
jgi:hypothetical protein